MSKICIISLNKFAIIQIFGFIACLAFFGGDTGLYPPLGSFHPIDTFMDMYNTHYFAYRDDRYFGWKSLYPPLSFAIGQLVSKSECNILTPLYFRQCDAFQIVHLIVLNILACLACGLIFAKGSESKRIQTTVLVAIILFFSLSNLYALERANQITYVFFLLSIGMCFGSNWAKILALSICINIKPYTVLIGAYYVLQKDVWSIFALIVTTGLIFFVSSTIIGSHELFEFLTNIVSFNANMDFSVFEKLWFPTSTSSWYKVVSLNRIVAGGYSIPDKLRQLVLVVYLLSICVAATSIIGYILMSKKLNLDIYASVVMTALIVISDSVGGYGVILLYPFYCSVLRKPSTKTLKLFCVSLLASIDFPVYKIGGIYEYSYIMQSKVFYQPTLTVMGLARPILIAFLLISLMSSCLKNEKYN